MIRLSAFSDEAASDLSGQISALKRNGIGYTELRSIDGKNVAKFTEAEAKEYAKRLAGEGVAVWAIGSPLGKVDIDTDFSACLDEVKHVCALANIFGTDKIRVFSFFNAYEKRGQVFDYLSGMAETAAEYGAGLYHENEKEVYGDTAARVLELMANVRGLKFVYDPANYIQVGEDADTTLSLLHARSDYFHIKDVVKETGELVPAGQGSGEIAKLIGMIDGDKTLTLEPHLAVFSGYADIDHTEMKHRFAFSSNAEAFDAAARALKDLLFAAGYREEKGGFVR
ncbi:MAG TPA: sugar phosphate isomerase/epimerase [Candidatus Scatosoma pullicola]|nr:sugar phosphate isomerase/epimerase [Candidatus Scatosoma pullicola]